MLEPPTAGVAKGTVTEDPPPVTVSFRYPITPAPVTVGMAAAPHPLRPLAVAGASAALVAPEKADVDAAEPQALERPQLSTHDVRISASSDDALLNDNYQKTRIVSETPFGVDPVEQKLRAEAMTAGRQLSRHRQNVPPIKNCETRFQ